MDNDIRILDKEFLHKKGLCGLKNLGNTCFMNTVIQCLSNTYPLLKYMFENNWKEELNEENDEHILVEQWYIVLKNLWHKNAVYSPNDFLSTVQQLARNKDYQEFTGLRQSDTQEFLQFFLENIHNSLSKEVNMDIVGVPVTDFDKLAIDAYKNYKQFFKNDYSAVIDIFYGQYSTIVKTKEKGKKDTLSRSFEPFSLLTLEIKPNENKEYNLNSCLEHFCKPERIDNGPQTFLKEVKFWSLPKILIIMFKRYTNDIKKNDTIVDFPVSDTLDMSKYVIGYNRNSYKYQLYAVANQDGFLGGGHYWACVKNYDNNWYKYNDHIVSKFNDLTQLPDNAYCLFYRKINN